MESMIEAETFAVGREPDETDLGETSEAVGPETAEAAEPTERDEWILRALYSDDSETFRSPSYPARGQQVSVRLRVERELDARATLILGDGTSRIPLQHTHTDALFHWHEATFQCGIESLTYRLLVEGDDWSVVYLKDGPHWADEPLEDECDFHIVFDAATPAWAQGAIQYQIFPDRFSNGDRDNDVVDREYYQKKSLSHLSEKYSAGGLEPEHDKQQGAPDVTPSTAASSSFNSDNRAKADGLRINDVVDREYSYDGSYVRKCVEWDTLPESDDYRCFYGGDLQGVMAKLDYLQSLGVEAIYLNPIFVSPSSHKYDTQDYYHIDPHLAIINDDVDLPLDEGNFTNRDASQYIRRTTSRENLERSDEYFAELCQEIHRRGMHIILDGVFNHCGSFSAWMDREGIYQKAGRRTRGAFLTLDSPFRPYFNFKDDSTTEYEAWWGFPTLPKLNYENSPELCDKILGIARRWALPPYSIDGWRLDVAADLGHSETFNHEFWRRFRRELKSINPELLIVAEHYGNPEAWLRGDQWDTVMNYDAFMDPLTYFLTGMEKHSDARNDKLYQDGAAFCETMRQNMARFGWGSLLCAMNELSNHDHSRFLTRTNRVIGRIGTAGSAAAGEGIDKRVLREAVVVQMTWPGSPTIYYGDEAGQVGWTDPDCRRTYPWGNEDQDLIEMHRALAEIRRQHPSLRSGSHIMLGGGDGWIAFGRFLKDDRVAIACNNADEAQVMELRLREVGMEDGCRVETCLQTTDDGFMTNLKSKRSKATHKVAKVRDGMLSATLAPRTAIILAALE